jgi:hypothetical protein
MITSGILKPGIIRRPIMRRTIKRPRPLQKAGWINEVYWVVAAIAEEISIAGGEADRILLQEAAEERVIHSMAVIVDAQLLDVLAAGEHETVPVPTFGPDVTVRIGNRGRTESVVSIFFNDIIPPAQQGHDIPALILLIEEGVTA